MKKTFFKFVAASVAMFAVIAAFGDVIYVSPTGTGDGTSESASCNLSTGWAKLTARPAKDMELILADGTYKLDAQLPNLALPDVNGVTYLIHSKNNNPANCIIDGQNKCRIAQITDGGQSSDKKRYAIIRGITFKNGKYTTPGNNDGGGAMYLQGTLDNCVVEDSTVTTSSTMSIGGGIYALRGTVIKNCIIRNCSSQVTAGDYNVRGGGIYFHENGSCSVSDTQIINCFAKCTTSKDGENGGGGIFNYNMPMTLKNVLISGCYATNTVGNVDYVKGGGIFKRASADTYDNVRFENCAASGIGGAFYQNNQENGDVFTDCSFDNCYARYGGAVCGSTLNYMTFVRCIIRGCSAELTSALAMGLPNYLDNTGGKLTMSNCVIRANKSTGGYGVIKTGTGAEIVDTVIEDNKVNTSHGQQGGLIYCHCRSDRSFPHLYEGLIIRNNTTYGEYVAGDRIFNDGLFRVNNTKSTAYTNIVIRNCYITGNTATTVAAIRNSLSTMDVDETDKGVYFINCDITGNTLSSSAAMFVARTDNTPSLLSINVRNCDLRGNNGPTKVLSDEIFSLNPRKVDHCAVDSGMSNYSAEPAQANLVGGPLPGKGAYMSWMDSALDGGDGTFTEVQSNTYGVKVTMNNSIPRYQGANPDIGARETDEGGTPSGPDPVEAQLRAYTSVTNAIVLTEGDTFTLPPLAGAASYVSTSAHRFLSVDGNILTAMSAGIGAFKAYNRDGLYIGMIPVFIKPAGRQIGNIYILNVDKGTTCTWSNPEHWIKVGSSVNDGFPNGQSDIAFVPWNKSNSYLDVDGSYSLAGLYCSHVSDSSGDTSYYLRGKMDDGSSSLTFYGTIGRKNIPAQFMAANQSSRGVMQFYPRGSSDTTKIAFVIGRGDLNLDCGGPADKIKTSTSSANVMRWYNDNSYGVYEIPADCRLCFVNGIRYGSFGDNQMWSEQHINMGGADIFTGTGTVEFNSCSAVSLWSNSLRSFSGTVKSQTLNYVRGMYSNRSGILWSVNVNAENVDAEINGFTTRDFNHANGVGAWCSGNSHGYGNPDSMNGNGLPGKSLTLNGGLLQLFGMSKKHSNANPFWPRSDGLFEAHYQTSDLRIGKGLSAIDNAWNATVSADGAISHFIADKVTHADPCGTLRLSDAHAINNKSLGTYRSENTLVGFSNHYVGYKGVVNYAQNIFPIVPWAIAQYSSGNERTDYLWWLGVDANNNVIRVGDRNNIDRNNMQMNQNAFVNGNIDITTDKDVNSLVVNDKGNFNKNLGAGRTLTIRSGGLGLEQNGSMLGTQTGGDANGTVVFSEKAFVFASSTSESDPNQIWSKIKAEKGFVSGYCGHLLLAGDQSGIKGELTINNGTLQLGSMDGTVACQLGGVTEVRAIGGNTVLRINKEGALDGKTIRFECPGNISPKFKLQNAEQEHCYKLYIDGKSIRSGSWGATGSGAANIDDEHFTGPGVLVVQRDDVGVGFSMVFRP